MTAASSEAKEKVRRYYLAATSDYLRYYETEWHQHMHYGFERGLPKGGNPTENLIRYAASAAGSLRGQRVLDAGCGVGGTALWMAENAEADCVGLNLMEFQLRLARGFAEKKGLSSRVSFTAGDFMHPPFAPASFDAIFAVESFDHAPDKAAWISGMAALLRPGGRLILVDGFRKEGEFSPQEDKAYKAFLRGWAVPHLCSQSELRSWASSAGLKESHGEDITADVMPHASAISRFALIFVPLRLLLLALRLTSLEKLDNAAATWRQYQTLKKGLWNYSLFCFRKPEIKAPNSVK